ncbi:MAG: T9SS type A sorting domain-containing protein, partial [Bacteroidota bacterium]
VYLAFGKGQIAKGVVNAATTGIEDHGDVLTNPPFPNPARNRVSIRVGWFVTVAPSAITLKVYNSLGQEVRDLTMELRSRVEGLSSTVTIDISDLPPGVYYAVTRAGRDLSTQQIMVQR